MPKRSASLDGTRGTPLRGTPQALDLTEADHPPQGNGRINGSGDARAVEAQATMRAIAAGEVDAFVVSNGGQETRVFSLSTADRPYRMFVQNMRDGAATLSAAGRVLYANRRLAELLGIPIASIVGSPLADFAADPAHFDLQALQGAGGTGATIELALAGAAGQRVDLLAGSFSLDSLDEDFLCVTFTDLTVHKAQEREIARLSQERAEHMAELQLAHVSLTRQATHDALTGLPNRALLVDRINQALAQAERSGRHTAVMFVDLDRFKQVNDRQGHAAGNTLLRTVAETLIEALRPMDTVARIGGDEFAVLAPDIDSQLHAVDLCQRVLAGLARHPTQQGAGIDASVGVTVSVGGLGTAESLLADADAAMYRAKARGGRRAEVFDAALGQEATNRANAHDALALAIEQGRVVAEYEPLIDLASGRVVGLEATAAIRQLGGAVRGGSTFLPAAEEDGLVVQINTQMLWMACTEAQTWARGASVRMPVTVSISGRQFESGDLPRLVDEALVMTGLPASSLDLEMAETSVVNLDPEVIGQLESICELGVHVGLDAFGTGYASLKDLRHLPLSFVNIDASFVHGLASGDGRDDGDARIVAAVVDLAAHLGLRSIAAGVETADQRDQLKKLGCVEAQGPFFSRRASSCHLADVRNQAVG